MNNRTTPTDPLTPCEERFRVLLEFSADWYWEQDAELRFTVFTGRSQGPAEALSRMAIGRTAWELPQLLNPGDPNWSRYRELSAERKPFRDLRLSRRDAEGRPHHFNVSGEPVFDAGGAFRGYRGVGRDVTAELLASEALRQSEAQLRLIAEIVPQVLWIIDLDQRRQVYVSPAYEKIWNRSLASLNADPDSWKEAVHPDDIEQVLLADGRPLQGEFSADYRIVRPDGSVRWIQNRAFPVPRREGEPRRVVGISADVTERRNAAEAIRQLNATLEHKVAERTAELEAALREMEAFSFSISHDLRAPLRAIDGFAKILAEEHASSLDDEGRGYLARISGATLKMAAMIDALLGLARVSYREICWEPVDLAAIAREKAAELRDAAPGRTVVFRIAADARAHGDPALLRIALQNLLGNAWKYTARNTRAQIDFGLATTGSGPAFYVRDNGVGFEMQYAERLFGPFQRLHSPTDFEGHGIGLATVARIVRRHRGRVWAEAAPGKGATFYFTLGEP